MRTRWMAMPAVALALAACTATTSGRGMQSGRDVLTRGELEETMQVTAYDAIRQARPSWLRVRGPNSFTSDNPILVYVDGVRNGDLDALRGIPVLSIERMRFYDATEAQARFGLNHTNGAIEVITRKGP